MKYEIMNYDALSNNYQVMKHDSHWVIHGYTIQFHPIDWGLSESRKPS